ncbi:hypothetical protein C5167_047721 [Papaver somniferum]|uniref:Uncharacterized protein n=1 Tax=Papaver somniferum TaxID=3469 RepID=A0A4Y7LLD4_PAPSO|nr:hypothetical protein C5167_047721 [Papaver somniferum]
MAIHHTRRRTTQETGGTSRQKGLVMTGCVLRNLKKQAVVAGG